MWALRLRNSSADYRARASWTVGSVRSSTRLRSQLTYTAQRVATYAAVPPTVEEIVAVMRGGAGAV